MRPREAQVYDLGYQRYSGPREGRSRAWRAVFENGVRRVLGIGRGGRAKILPVFLFLAVISPAVVFVVILTFVGEGGSDFIPGPADYYSIVAAVLVLFAAIMGPEVLGPDRRDNVLPLYFVRPMKPMDYVSARFLAFFLVMLALVYAGQAVLQLGLIFTAGNQMEYLRENWGDIPRILFMGVVVAFFISIAPMAVSAFTTRRVYAAAFIVAAWLLSGAVADGITSFRSCETVEVIENGEVVESSETCDWEIGPTAPYIGLLHLGIVTDNINVLVFDYEVTEQNAGPSQIAVAELPDAFPIGVYVFWTGLSTLLLWRRYRSVQL